MLQSSIYEGVIGTAIFPDHVYQFEQGMRVMEMRVMDTHNLDQQRSCIPVKLWVSSIYLFDSPLSIMLYTRDKYEDVRLKT